MKQLDERGIPGTFVVTNEFKQAAEFQCNALGYEPGIVWLPHPIQNRTAEELRELAEDIIDRVLAMITAS